MNPAYHRSMINEVKAEIEAINIDINEQKEQITELKAKVQSLAEMLGSVSSSLRELTVAIAAGLPVK